MDDRKIIGVGLVVAVAAGITAGGFESVDTVTVLYAISSVGWVVATALLAARHIQSGESVLAAGFIILTVAESLLWVSGRPGDPDYDAGFAGGAMFYVPGLLLIGLPSAYHWVTRLLAVAGAVVWSVAVAGYLTGSGLNDDDPVALAGYTLLSATFVGIALRVMRSRDAAA